MLITAIIFGLLSSLHCVGMCGPIALMLPVDRHNNSKKVLQMLLYHFGRMLSYGSLGLIFGVLGKGLVLAGLQQQISLIAGLMMLVFVLIPEQKILSFKLLKPLGLLFQNVKNNLGKQFQRKTNDAFFTIGVFNGFLPCGLVYVALFGALTMSTWFQSVVYMMLFGLGTIPMMSLVTMSSQIISTNFRIKIQKVIPILLIIMASLFIVRGLGLDIPFLSPSSMNLLVKPNVDCH